MAGNVTSLSAERRLAEIIRQVKVATAERDDVVVDMKEADRARLELLAEALKPVIDDVPREIDQFDFGITTGPQPRFWIDAVAHVHMGKDRRTYRFVRDTRLGRVVLAEGGRIEPIADSVGRYIAERLIERQRMMDGDMEPVRDFYERRAQEEQAAVREAVALKEAKDLPSGLGAKADQAHLPPMTSPVAPLREPSPAGFAIGLSWFILGCVAGAGAFVLAFWERLSGALN